MDGTTLDEKSHLMIQIKAAVIGAIVGSILTVFLTPIASNLYMNSFSEKDATSPGQARSSSHAPSVEMTRAADEDPAAHVVGHAGQAVEKQQAVYTTETPAQILQWYDGYSNEAVADTLFSSAYEGKRVVWTGTIESIIPSKVLFPGYAVEFADDTVPLKLTVGEKITVDGQIDYVMLHAVYLSDARIMR